MKVYSKVCVCHWWNIKNKTCLTKRKLFSRPRKGRNPETDASVLQYFKDLQNKGSSVIMEALMSNVKGCARTVIYLSRIVMDGVKSLWTEKAYHYDKARKLVIKLLSKNVKLRWLNFSILFFDYTEAISIFKPNWQCRWHSSFLMCLANYNIHFQGEKTSDKEKHRQWKSYVLLSCCV